MRHQVRGRKLGRTASHRKATMQALSVALIKEQRIQTTLAKAKELRRYVEPLITRAKEDTTHNRRQVFASLQDKYAVTQLFDDIAPAAKDRPGGYTRVLKLGYRLGDAAQMAVIELVDFNDVQPEGKESKKKRTRRAGKSNKPAPAQQEQSEEEKAADPKKGKKPEAKTEVESEKKETPVKAESDSVEEASEKTAPEASEEDKKGE